MFWQTKTKRVRRGQLFSLPRNVENRKSPKSWRWKKCEIPLRLRDFQAEWESPAVGLFHAAAFSTAFLPANSATEPIFLHFPTSSLRSFLNRSKLRSHDRRPSVLTS